MIRQRSGVILTFGGDGGGEPVRDYSIGGLQVALNAVGFLRRQRRPPKSDMLLYLARRQVRRIADCLPTQIRTPLAYS